ncbi:hypothetical protein F383_39259 [Gossypium arboreum]|uniref:Uncharacterized protein n=1 Tax=Gossypium arboreum TaxID=29729 RepID=A0A0B0ML04_GOSAR|nr:hypothetical protein F383_39259 [Gossypium arboreum]
MSHNHTNSLIDCSRIYISH